MYIPKRKTDSLAPSDVAAVAAQRLHDCYQRMSVAFARQALETEDVYQQIAAETLAEQYAQSQRYVKQAIGLLAAADSTMPDLGAEVAPMVERIVCKNGSIC